MNSDRSRIAPIAVIAAFLVVMAGQGCNESLPVYEEPQNVLQLRVVDVEQLNDHVAPPGHQAVRIVLRGTNVFDEPFLDSVRFRGTMRISWIRQPFRSKTILLTEKDLSDPSMIAKGKMLLVPTQSFSMEVIWDMRTDDGIYLPYFMNFAWLTRRICAPNIACADPEDFLVETTLRVYDRLGELQAPPEEFTFVGRTRIN
jgi:hypothetical protein